MVSRAGQNQELLQPALHYPFREAAFYSWGHNSMYCVAGATSMVAFTPVTPAA